MSVVSLILSSINQKISKQWSEGNLMYYPWTEGLFGTAPTPKYNSRSWVWSEVVELPKLSSTTLVHFMRELHPTPLPVLVELKLFGWDPTPGGMELELELCQTGPELFWSKVWFLSLLQQMQIFDVRYQFFFFLIPDSTQFIPIMYTAVIH